MTRNLYVADDVWNDLLNPDKEDLKTCKDYWDCERLIKYFNECGLHAKIVMDDAGNIYIQYVDNTCKTYTELGEINYA